MSLSRKLQHWKYYVEYMRWEMLLVTVLFQVTFLTKIPNGIPGILTVSVDTLSSTKTPMADSPRELF